MKKVALLICILSVFCVHAKAVTYCATSSWGYAGTNVTGGGTATPTLVSNQSQLAAALNTKNSVIIITQDITVTNHISSDKNNLTIMALPGKKLISNKQNQDESGILYLKGNNIIIRNVTFVGPGAYDCDGWDNLCLDKATNVWVDHCDFQDGCDGNFDIKSTSDNITVTWCRFRYLKAPKAGGSGGSDDHRFSNLVGSGSSDKPSDGTYNITYAFCWWDEGCKQRMTRCRNCELHFLNCYWNSSVADYYVGPENAKCYFEGCTFAGKANSPSKIWSDSYSTSSPSYCTFVNCTGNLPDNTNPGVSAPTYSYDHLSAADAKTYVTNSTCGAGATLTVTNTAEVSSACDGDEPEPEPQPEDSTLTWNFSTSSFNALGTITSTTTVKGLTMTASSEKAVTIAEVPRTIDTLSFTHVLKFNGSGNASYRSLSFGVTGACTIEVYLISANPTSQRTLNIYSGSYGGTLLTTMLADSTIAAKRTYSYTGNATTIYMGSANSGINVYAINLLYQSAPSTLEPVQNKSAAHKVLRNGQVLIERDNKVYNLFGIREQ